MSELDNPPAFPFVLPDEIGGYQMVEPGMSLRDWFAGQALVGLLTLQNDYTLRSPKGSAAEAYEYADAMLACRSKPQ